MHGLEQRRQSIYEIVKERGYVGVADLAGIFDVTMATIRSDLQKLEDNGMVVRSHGGAVLASTTVVDLKEDIKSKVNVVQKKRIAAAATGLLGENESILIASGSTMVRFAQAIRPKGHMNVVTPSIRIAMTFIDNPEVSIFQLGGLIHDNTLSTRGTYAEAGLQFFLCNKLFFGVEGFDLQGGLTCATVEEANLTDKMLKSATSSIVLADSSKFGRRGFGRICAMGDIDILVTDDGLPDDARAAIEAVGTKVIIAK